MRTTFEYCEHNEKCQETKEDRCGNKLNKGSDDEPNEKTGGRRDKQLGYGRAEEGERDQGSHQKQWGLLFLGEPYMLVYDRR